MKLRMGVFGSWFGVVVWCFSLVFFSIFGVFLWFLIFSHFFCETLGVLLAFFWRSCLHLKF